MSRDDIVGLRSQILANAKLLLRAKPSQSPAPHIALPTPDASNPPVAADATDIGIVVFGHSQKFTAAIMLGLTPAVEGPESPTPESSLLKLLNATCELLNIYMPKIESHQRNIHGGGVFDEALLVGSLVDAQSRTS